MIAVRGDPVNTGVTRKIVGGVLRLVLADTSEVSGFSIHFGAVGLLFIGLSIPLILGRVPPNHSYGCRTQKTLSDPKIWYEANRVAGKDFLIAGAMVLIASLGTLVFGQRVNPYRVVITLLLVMVFIAQPGQRGRWQLRSL